MPLVEQHSDIIRLEPPSLLLEFGRSNSCVFLPTIPTMAQRSRQLLADMYSRLVTDQTALKSLTSSTKPLRTFAHELASLTSKPEAVLGEDVKTTDEWLDQVEGMNGSLETLDKKLEPITFLSGNAPTAADYSLFASLYDIVSTLPPAAQHAHPSLVRYFSHMSHLSAGSNIDPPVKPFEPVYEGFPKIVRKAEPKKEKKAKDEAAPAEGATAKPKKEKKAKDKSSSGNGGAAAAPDSGPLPSMVDLRVGKIVKVERHPDADSLYLEQVDFGEADGPRTILSGLVNFVPMDEMQNRWIVGVCNLKPVSMRGIKSFGMILCATAREGKEGGVQPVSPPEGSQLGDRVFVDGYEGMEPLEQMNPKKKVFETIQPNYTSTDAKECAWVGPGPNGAAEEKSLRLLRTARGVCMAHFAGASLS